LKSSHVLSIDHPEWVDVVLCDCPGEEPAPTALATSESSLLSDQDSAIRRLNSTSQRAHDGSRVRVHDDGIAAVLADTEVRSDEAGVAGEVALPCPEGAVNSVGRFLEVTGEG
jgi:hypothetical protein